MARTQNVFAELGLDHADATVEAWRSDLARIIRAYFLRAQTSQGAFANRLGVKQPVVSRIINGRLRGFSIESLLRLCVKLETRGTANWGPSSDEAFVTTDLQTVTGTTTSVSSIDPPSFEATAVEGIPVARRTGGGSARRVRTN